MIDSLTKLYFTFLIQMHTMQNSTLKKDSHRPLTPTMEDYLEAIFNLGKEKRAVRVKDMERGEGR